MQSKLELILRENIQKQALIKEFNIPNLINAQEEFPIGNKINNEPLILLVAAKHFKTFSHNEIVINWFDPLVGIVTEFDVYGATSVKSNNRIEGFVGTMLGMEVYTDYWMADIPQVKFLTYSMFVQLRKPMQSFIDSRNAQNHKITNMNANSSYWQIYRSHVEE